MVTCYIAFGSNLGDRSKNIKLALRYLNHDPCINILKVSSLIESAPVAGPEQAKFLNGVVKLNTTHTARQLLKMLQQIEVRLGRPSLHPRNHPRTIDLDILFFGDLTIDQPNLKIPHPRLRQREFVKTPLREIAPELLSRQGVSCKSGSKTRHCRNGVF